MGCACGKNLGNLSEAQRSALRTKPVGNKYVKVAKVKGILSDTVSDECGDVVLPTSFRGYRFNEHRLYQIARTPELLEKLEARELCLAGSE